MGGAGVAGRQVATGKGVGIWLIWGVDVADDCPERLGLLIGLEIGGDNVVRRARGTETTYQAISIVE
jgi:hypothetical protein